MKRPLGVDGMCLHKGNFVVWGVAKWWLEILNLGGLI